MNNECCLVRSRVIVGVVGGYTTGYRVRSNPRELVSRRASKSETRGKIINQVVETTEGLLNAKRGDQIANLRVVVTNIVAESGFSLKLIRCLRRKDESKHRAAILTAICVVTATPADDVVVALVEDCV